MIKVTEEVVELQFNKPELKIDFTNVVDKCLRDLIEASHAVSFLTTAYSASKPTANEGMVTVNGAKLNSIANTMVKLMCDVNKYVIDIERLRGEQL